jgi:disulfide bond formation protein DsbB
MPFNTRVLWLATAAAAAALAIVSVLLTVWLNLQPCHLCIFQRLLFMIIAVLAAIAALTPLSVRRVAGIAVAVVAAAGTWTAAYQSWLQAQPPGSVSCIGGELGPVERLVEWLGQQSPSLFLATGFCEDEALVILGLSIVNWALLSFVATFAIALWLVRRR